MKLFIPIVLVVALLSSACAQEDQELPPVEMPAPYPVVEEELPPLPVNTDVNTFIIRKGDGISYKGNSMAVEDITSGGSTVNLLFPDGSRLNLFGTKSPEIYNGMEFELTAINFNTDRSVTLHIQEFVPKENEYFIVKGRPVSVAGNTVQVNYVSTDSFGSIRVRVLVPEVSSDEVTIKLGETASVGNLEITPLRAFFKNKESALLKILQK
ncbi:MAG TPA: hypothetical protein HA362_01170 [Nanoarchaeota archaeon]|nr:hypothetical protein [Nanoarchaeota archaeon]